MMDINRRGCRHLSKLGLIGVAMGVSSLCAQTTDENAASWISTEDGAWEEGSNWDFGDVPNGAGVGATLGLAGFTDEVGTRAIALASDVKLGRLTFGSTRGAVGSDGTPGYRNYLVTGPGALVLDGGDGETVELIAYSTGSGNAHQIDADVKISSPVDVAIGDASRKLVIAGAISGDGNSPIKLNIKGEALLGSLLLLGENDFAEGQIAVTSNNVLDLGSSGAAAGATISLAQEGKGGVRLSASSPKDLTFNYKVLDVQASGSLFVERVEMDVVGADSGQTDAWDWGADPYTGNIRIPSIQIAPGQTLSITHQFHNQNLIVSDGSEILLGSGSSLRIESIQPNRGMNLRIASGGALRGDGTVTTFAAEGSSLVTKLFIDRGGLVAPGSTESPGRLHLGESLEAGRSIFVDAGPESKFRFRMNGPEPATGYDQIVLNGTLNLDEAELELTTTGVPRPTDILFLIVSAEGSDVTGAFYGAADGEMVSIAGPDGREIQAKISYNADAAKGSATGGRDIAVHGFR